MNTDTPYPPHTPPAPPEGMKWEYRGMGWNPDVETTAYSVFPSGASLPAYPVSEDFCGRPDLHFFEAVSIHESGVPTGIGGLEPTDDWLDDACKDPVTENPKELQGRKKCPMQLLPPEFLRQTANALGHGADRYGAWNWRDQPIKLSTYLGAMMRHLVAIADGEDIDESGFPHAAHVAASCAILLDAGKHGTLADDRPRAPEMKEDMMEKLFGKPQP